MAGPLTSTRDAHYFTRSPPERGEPLKVLRSFGSTGSTYSESETLTWVEDGLKQAVAYRDERGVLSAALCCFDMRCDVTGDACFAHVASDAIKLNVLLRCYHLFATSKDYRDFLVKLSSPSAKAEPAKRAATSSKDAATKKKASAVRGPRRSTVKR